MNEHAKVEDFYVFKFKTMWRYFKSEHFSFWMICCYLFLEFVRPQSLFPAIDILPWAQLCLIGALAGAIIDPSVKWVSSAANKWMFIFCFLILLSVVNAIYPSAAQKNIMDYISWFIVYFLIINIVNTKERFYIFLTIFLITGAKISIGTAKIWVFRGFSFTSWGLMGPQGYFQNSGELAILMLMLFPLSYYLSVYFRGKASRLERIFLLVCWVCPILTILGASSRGSQIALVAQLILMFRRSLWRPKALIGVSILCFALFNLLPAEQKERFSNSGDDRTSKQRLLYWEHGWDMMLERPFTGVGFFNFSRYYEAHFSQDMLYERAELPHNIFIQTGTDAGFPGAITFGFLILSSFFIAIRLSYRYKGSLTSAIAAGFGYGLMGYTLAGQFVTVAYYPFLWIGLAFLVALSNIASKQSDKTGTWLGRHPIDVS